MSFTLGYTPEKFKVVLTRGADFFASLRRSDGEAWPETARLVIAFPGIDITFVATLNGPTATWNEDSLLVSDLINLKPKSVQLWYFEGEDAQTEVLWAQGAPVVAG